MGIDLTFTLEELAGNLTEEQKAASEEGTLNPDEVYFQFLCTTNDATEEHDPDADPDDRVRPEHAALHGEIFRIDDPMAPVPPLDFGCRCAMKYCGAPDSIASYVLGSEAESEPTTIKAAYGTWLDKNAEGWEEIGAAILKLPPVDRAGAAYLMVKELGISNPRSVANMIVSAAGAK